MGLLDRLSEAQAEAVKTIDEDLEIIACAGAGKTGVVTRRIINLNYSWLFHRSWQKPHDYCILT